jgi:flagellin-like protein
MKHIRNEEAVSPVIGVILMVVITVIIAAVMAVFAFGVGAPAKVPSAQLKYEASTNLLTISNTGGDSLILSELSISVGKAPNSTGVIDNKQMNNFTVAGSSSYLVPGKSVNGTFTMNPSAGDIIRIQIMHISTGQSVADTRVTVH